MPERTPYPAPSTSAAWGLLLGASIALSLGFHAAHLPAAPLFAGVLAGFLVNSWVPLRYPLYASRTGQSVLGVAIGLLFSPAAWAAVSGHLWSILGVTLVTLLLSLGSGILFSRWGQLRLSTGLLAMTAGGAAGITAIAQEFAADVGLVAIVQYVRVLLVMASIPLMVWLMFHGSMPAPSSGPVAASWGWTGVILVICVLPGIWLGKRLHLAAPFLLGPMLLALALTLSGWIHGAPLPSILLQAAYLLIGWQAGLQLSIRRLREHLRRMPLAIAIILSINALCAVLGVLLAHVAGVSDLDGYLATAPGGLYVAVAVSMAAHGNVIFVLGVHLIRLLLMLLVMPSLARAMLHRQRGPEL